MTRTATITDYKTTVPDFTGVPQITLVSKKTSPTNTVKVQTNFTYDQSYRITAVSQAYNGGAFSVVAAYSYNELGQVIQKNLGQITTGTVPPTLNLSTYSGTTAIASSSIGLSPTFTVPSGSVFNAFISTGYLQTVDMRYNIRGQLLSINNSKLKNDGGVTNNDNTDVFGMTMLYDGVDTHLGVGGNKPYYNGKLSAVKWMTADVQGRSGNERAFMYHYDGQDRYTGEIYAERAITDTGPFTVTHGWDERSISYDADGNLLTLSRNTATQNFGPVSQIDSLTYSYYSSTIPNQLKSVTDASGSSQGFVGGMGTYNYDPNGNLTNEPYKGISQITYDVLNRTDKITFTSSANRYLTYTYDANGALIRKMQYDNVGGAATLQYTTDYIDGFVYITPGTGAAALSYFPMPEGRVLYSSGIFTQQFILTDPQGNARISFQNNGNGNVSVQQETSYYGFGYQMAGSLVALPPVPNKQLYNGGSEWQNDYSNLPDYDQTFFRNYDAALGRWIGVDPTAESAESMSGYQYAGNNPIMMNDPDGNKLNTPPNWFNYGPSPLTPPERYGGDSDFSEDEGYTGGEVDYSNGPFAGFWNYVLSAAEDILGSLNTASINTSNITKIDFQNPQALYDLAFTSPGSYNLSFSHGNATLTENVASSNSPSGASAPMFKAVEGNRNGDNYNDESGNGANPFAINIYRVPGYFPPIGSNIQENNLCVFYTTSAAVDHYAGAYAMGGMDVFHDFSITHHLTRTEALYIKTFGIDPNTVFSLFVCGRDTNDIMGALLNGFPVAASINAPPYGTASMGHEVLITGFGVSIDGTAASFYFIFRNSQTGTDNYLSPSSFSNPYAITGAK